MSLSSLPSLPQAPPYDFLELLSITTWGSFLSLPRALIHYYLELFEEVVEVHNLASDIGVEEVVGDALEAEVVSPQRRHCNTMITDAGFFLYGLDMTTALLSLSLYQTRSHS